ncbi:PucR family transcriptional regulator [Streptacidiphilus fuscans]|uniref:PucR family transcriptional regulator ligand-binding domain-containing protein n=1 Tax=Streptacidiphilus fuscans TaxID=2789292 RepID=A0A931B4M5_9ACTN|nr:PucR family transcriptional regulator [Streptacidiphilus fuscans]MBF9070224.1 PucR family transcriptional regulator ligand-binding domain-containing protein [Streptacidiphilus fuscans]
MRIGALLAPTAPPMRLLAGEGELDRVVTGVMTTDLRDPSRYLHGGELVLTGMLWRYEPDDSERFVRFLAAGGAAGLAAGEAEVGPVPQDLVDACARHRMPLFAVGEDVAFGSVTEYVVRQVSADRAADLSALVDRHRMLVSAAGGAGLDAVLDLLGGDVDLDCWVLTPTGRVVAGPAGGLEPAERDHLARAHLEAQRRRHAPSTRARVGAREFSLLPVAGGAALAQWILAIEGDVTEWTVKRQQLAENLARLVSAERVRRDESRTLRSRLADEMIALLQRDAAPDELLRALEAAHAMTLSDVSTGQQPLPTGWVVVSVESQGLGEGEAREAVVEAVTGLDDRALVGGGGLGAIVLLPQPVGKRTAAEVLGDLFAPLDAGLGPEGRLTIGVSAPATGVGGLRGALEEARHARRIASARVGRICVAGPEELASHVLLLAAVPDEVRRAFRSRLLDRVVAYDLEHQADLVRTLEAFLRYDGSWTRCAAALHVHVNTLRYRIGRIEELTGRDLSKLEDRVDFFLALELS